MANWRERLNLFYYNIFRFERYTQYLVCSPLYGGAKLTRLGNLMEERSGKENWNEYLLSVLNDSKGGISLHFAGMHIALLVMLVLLTLLNVFCGLLRLSIHTFWFYGMIGACILTAIISYNAAPVDRKKYLKDFKKFESRPKSQKRQSAFITFLIIIGIWVAFITSFLYYLRSSVG